MLAQAVQARVIRKTRAESHVLVLKDDVCSRRVEKNLTTPTSDHREAERIFLVLELEVRAIATAPAAIWAFEHRVWDLVDFVGRILYLHVQTLIFAMCQYWWSNLVGEALKLTTLILHSQSELFQIGAVDIASGTS